MIANIRFLAVLFCSLLLLSSCAASESPTRRRSTDPTGAAIEKVMDADRCDANHKWACDLVDVEFKPDPSAAPSGDAILILDVAMGIATLGLHRDRVVAHYQLSPEAPYVKPFQPKTRFPQAMDLILHHILKGKQRLASSKALADVGRRFNTKYLKTIEDKNLMGHGTTSFNILAELNPNAPFVIVHADNDQPPICQLTSIKGEEALAGYWNGKAAALAQVARLHHVKWVNYSMGYEVRGAKALWKDSHCPGLYPTDEQFRWYVRQSNAVPRALTAVPGLLFVQAAPYSNDSFDTEVQKDYEADCERIPNRLRVGYYHAEATRLANDESRDGRLLPDEQKNVAPCTDLYLRDGLKGFLEATTTPIYYSAVGFGHGAMNVPGTSFIAPVGLSYAAYLTQSRGIAPDRIVPTVRGDGDSYLLVSPFADRVFLNSDANYLNYFQ